MRQGLFRAVALFVSLTVAIALVEVGLRISGQKPWSYSRRDSAEPTMHKPDAALGWKGAEGRFVLPPYSPAGSEFRFSLDARGARRTALLDKAPGNELVLIGGSSTQGWAIGDEETFAWKLQERLPAFKLVNYGTGGYGTYQSLLVLENELPLLKSPRVVVYPFIAHHEDRNVAAANWLRDLALHSRRGMIDLPYVTLGPDGSLVRHPAERYPALPLRTFSAAITRIEEIYMQFKTGDRIDQKRVVTRQLMREMAETTRQYGAKFLVVLLDAPQPLARQYSQYLSAHSIPVANCTHIKFTRVIGEGHPDGNTHTRWSRCILNALKISKLIAPPLTPDGT